MLLSILAGLATAVNLYFYSNLPEHASRGTVALHLAAQVAIAVVALIGFLTYRGRKTRPSYDRVGYRIWTFWRGLTVLALLGATCAIVLPALDVLDITW